MAAELSKRHAWVVNSAYIRHQFSLRRLFMNYFLLNIRIDSFSSFCNLSISCEMAASISTTPVIDLLNPSWSQNISNGAMLWDWLWNRGEHENGREWMESQKYTAIKLFVVLRSADYGLVCICTKPLVKLFSFIFDETTYLFPFCWETFPLVNKAKGYLYNLVEGNWSEWTM